MDVSPARINDRFRKGNTRNNAIKRKMNILQSFVTFIKRGKHSHKQENARRLRQIEKGILQVTG